jgi:hypothetical protein
MLLHDGPRLMGFGQRLPVGAKGPRAMLEAQHLGDEAALGDKEARVGFGRLDDTHNRTARAFELQAR